MRQISRLMLGLSALAFAGAFGASGPARAQSEAPKPKAEESAEPKREESKETKREEKTEKREDKDRHAARTEAEGCARRDVRREIR